MRHRNEQRGNIPKFVKFSQVFLQTNYILRFDKMEEREERREKRRGKEDSFLGLNAKSISYLLASFWVKTFVV